MTISYRSGVSIAELVVYVPALFVAFFLCIRHGFGRSAGWFFLIIFCLARIIGPSMQLATISDPTNISLYTGSAILQSIGLSPLLLASLGLLSRASDSIGRTRRPPVDQRLLRLIQTVIIVALVLGIVGGVNAGNNFQKTGRFQTGSVSKAGSALFIVSFVAVVAATVLLATSISHAEAGEKRLILAVGLSLPLLLVRLIYSCLSTFTHRQTFNQLAGNVTVLLCMAILEEFIVVLIYEGTGLTLKKLDKDERIPPSGTHLHSQVPSNTSGETPLQQQRRKEARRENPVLKIAKKTIIGRIIVSLVGSRRDENYEMERADVRR
ncbi:hypothetical protein F5884DRAFT_524141 [Xylogone sp. PMI_703]|nr:hypothetical protein F5884DRAFT_524141 [Xylogone sp. PMI_703]